MCVLPVHTMTSTVFLKMVPRERTVLKSFVHSKLSFAGTSIPFKRGDAANKGHKYSLLAQGCLSSSYGLSNLL